MFIILIISISLLLILCLFILVNYLLHAFFYYFRKINFSRKKDKKKVNINHFLKNQRKKNIEPINKECPICIDKIKNDLVLDCKHNFHKKCLKEYLKFYSDNNNILCNCPLCRHNIIII